MFVPEGPHCGRPGCQCTHTAPCDHGWISTDVGEVHCSTCHPGRRQEPTESRPQWMARLQREDARADRKKNTADHRPAATRFLMKTDPK